MQTAVAVEIDKTGFPQRLAKRLLAFRTVRTGSAEIKTNRGWAKSDDQSGPNGVDKINCYIRWQNVMLQEDDELARRYNHASDVMDAITGNYGLTPRMPTRRFVIQTGGVTLNNIHVSNSEIGVLNTGTIQNVDSTVTVLKSGGSTALAEAVTMLSEAVIRSADVQADQKNQILELLGALSQEAVAPKEKRKLAVARTLLTELSGVLSGISTLAQMWEKVHPIFRHVFGL